MSESRTLPPGQQALAQFPRFGLNAFADRFPQSQEIAIEIGGAFSAASVEADEFARLPRHKQNSDFHCVTTWSVLDLEWEGVLFRDFYSRLIEETGLALTPPNYVLFRCQDGFRAQLPLTDLLADDVLLADRLNGAPLDVAHGAPLRLVAPAHYGYKNPKHVNRIEFWPDAAQFQPPALAFMDHPTARVATEERGRVFPGWMLRYLYRPLVRSTIRTFERALAQHLPGAK